MKYYLLALVFGLSCFVAGAGQISEDELERLRDNVSIGSVNDDTFEVEVGDEEFEYVELKFVTFQHPDDAEKYKFVARVVIELTDKKTDTIVHAQGFIEQPELDTEYLGEDEWQFLVALGDMNRPKVTAYVIKYGIVVDKEFIVLASEFDDVESIDELKERTPEESQEKTHFNHIYFYTDGNDEDTWSGEF